MALAATLASPQLSHLALPTLALHKDTHGITITCLGAEDKQCPCQGDFLFKEVAGGLERWLSG